MSPTIDNQPSATRPTPKQLAYLRTLAERAGQSFAYPRTRREASAEIERLRRQEPSSRLERTIERHQIAEAIAAGPADASAIRPEEVSGYGSSATWRKAEPTDSPGAPPTRRPAQPVVGERVELARYTVRSEERVLYGQRIDGVVRVTDRPAADEGRSYLVERELELDGKPALKALIADYLRQARVLDEIPMAASAVRAGLARAQA